MKLNLLILISYFLTSIFPLIIGFIFEYLPVRGQNKDNPIILYVHCGPASPSSPNMWMHQRPLEKYFTVINYDQRASGKTLIRNDTLNLSHTLIVDNYVDDLILITDFFTEKFKKKKIILVGHSWGTIISMKAALKRPDLFYAYIGIGQVINTKQNEHLSYEFALKEAKARKDTLALAELKSIRPYPGSKLITRERIIIARKWPHLYDGLSAFRSNSKYYFNAPLLGPEYSFSEVKSIDAGSQLTLKQVLPEFLNIDFTSVTKFPIPVFMFMGRHDYTTPAEPTNKWIKNVNANVKEAIWFENSAHLIPIEEPGKILIELVSKVRPLARD